ncbi:hypothetical protein IFR05_013242 [Cadophora sp. M221]|nr:hypothetical protein IFR05_013242 [Cadophora sp. M221]
MSSSEVLKLYVVLGQRRGQNPLHWIILTAPEGSDRCTYYHMVGGPTQGKNYELQIQANKRVNSNGISAIAKGTTATWQAKMEPDPYAQSTSAPADSSSQGASE